MEFEFGGSHIAAQPLSALEDFWSGAFMHLTPSQASPNWKAQLGEEQFHIGLQTKYSFKVRIRRMGEGREGG